LLQNLTIFAILFTMMYKSISITHIYWRLIGRMAFRRL